ncbi:hypothetical protein [Erythrobacter litoralis]|uniref:hypothetical protein n=1 Tax=Erythrobacter litoralis TaxID=39960 RepID=UPI001F26D78D|nr:hypothetical protein [Erythrobacter litoralis]
MLIVLGTTLGWLSSIIARTEEPGEILRQAAAGLLVALISGLLVNGGVVLGGLSLVALGVALAATVGALVLYHAVIRRQVGA